MSSAGVHIADAAGRDQEVGLLYGPAGAYYLGFRHELIHRQTEKITIKPDQTGLWRLGIDLELPRDPEARVDVGEGKERSRQFVFPLLFLKKAEGRTGFGATDKDDRALTLLNRGTNNWISAAAAARAGNRILSDNALPTLDQDDLEYLLWCVCRWRPYDAAVVLGEMLARFESANPEGRAAWDEEGFTADLEMLADHSLVWTPLEGEGGERRSIEVRMDLELSPRPLRRWVFRELEDARWKYPRFRKYRKFRDPEKHLDTGGVKYGRRGLPRFSFSVLGERLAQPLAWMPIEFDFPTIYTRRCSSYHFELDCPTGLTPRAVKLATTAKDLAWLEGRAVLVKNAAEFYTPDGRTAGDLMFRATVGIGRGAVPLLWLMVGLITATMLWILAANHPTELLLGANSESRNEIAAGILLVVPALAAAAALGVDEQPATQLIAGARILLLVVGLCAVAAALVLIRMTPFGEPPRASWTDCAALATVATLPLATSWLLSLPAVWRGLGALRTTLRQYLALLALVIWTAAVVFAIRDASDGLVRELGAAALMLTSIPLILLAANRAAVPLNVHRGYASIGALLAAIVCLGLGCTEMRAGFDPGAEAHRTVEVWAMAGLAAALWAGPALTVVTWPFRQMEGEVHMAPSICKLAIDRFRIRDLPVLRGSRKGWRWRLRDWKKLRSLVFPAARPRAAGVPVEPVADSEADWSSGIRSTIQLPEPAPGEFAYFVGDGSQSRGKREQEEIRRMNERIDALAPAPPA